jgi:hypothetical protein
MSPWLGVAFCRVTEEAHRVVVETAIAAPFEAVWRALRDPAEIRRWHGWEFDGLDEEIDLIYVAGARASEDDGIIDFPEVGTRFAVEPRQNETLVTVTNAEPADGFDEIAEGWITFFGQLRFALERHPGEERRTLHLHGAAGPGQGPLTASRLGLDAADSAAPGERWAGTAAWGEALAGEVLHRSAHQVGVSVEPWDDAMLVLQATPAEVQPPRGGGRAIVSAYAVDERRLDGIRERFGGWFAERYAPEA